MEAILAKDSILDVLQSSVYTSALWDIQFWDV